MKKRRPLELVVINIPCPGQRGSSKSEFENKKSSKSPIPDKVVLQKVSLSKKRKVIKIPCPGQRDSSKSEFENQKNLQNLLSRAKGFFKSEFEQQSRQIKENLSPGPP